MHLIPCRSLCRHPRLFEVCWGTPIRVIARVEKGKLVIGCSAAVDGQRE